MIAEEKLENKDTDAHSHANEQTNKMGGSKRNEKAKFSLISIQF